MRRLRHRNVVQYLGSAMSGGERYILLECGACNDPNPRGLRPDPTGPISHPVDIHTGDAATFCIFTIHIPASTGLSDVPRGLLRSGIARGGRCDSCSRDSTHAGCRSLCLPNMARSCWQGCISCMSIWYHAPRCSNQSLESWIGCPTGLHCHLVSTFIRFGLAFVLRHANAPPATSCDIVSSNRACFYAPRRCSQVIHRDIKGENLLFADAERAVVKIADFGSSHELVGGATLTHDVRDIRGSPYAAFVRTEEPSRTPLVPNPTCVSAWHPHAP